MQASEADIARPRSQASIADDVVKRNVENLRPHERAFASAELAAQ
jgi:hypothetical protein